METTWLSRAAAALAVAWEEYVPRDRAMEAANNTLAAFCFHDEEGAPITATDVRLVAHGVLTNRRRHFALVLNDAQVDRMVDDAVSVIAQFARLQENDA